MFKAIRISILLLVLVFVGMGAWLTEARSTDWNNSLYVKVYPINGDGSSASAKHIDRLELRHFEPIEAFLQREVERYGKSIDRPVRVQLGTVIAEQPPAIGADANMLDVMLWSLKLRWWADNMGDAQDDIEPDVRIFVRYHEPVATIRLENSVGLQKGMVGIVNGYAGRQHRGVTNVIIAHEFLHTLGATDKYDPSFGHPIIPDGIAEPDRKPLYPQRFAELMGGRIALAEDDSVIPKSLKYVRIGEHTAREIKLAR